MLISSDPTGVGAEEALSAEEKVGQPSRGLPVTFIYF